MASSDDEEELVPQSVSNYFFVDAKEEPIPFSVLPFCFDGMDNPDMSKEQVFLHGTGDGGLQKVYKQVTAWKVGLEDAQPEILVFTKDNKWIKLSKPRKSYEGSIRSILITIHYLHFLRRKPESSEKSLWEYLRKLFSTFEDRPSVDDLVDHYPLIKLLVERDDALAKSQILQVLLKERPMKKAFGPDLQSDGEPKNSFIVDDDIDEDMTNDDGNESEEEPDLFDSVCAICDNGGEILCCEGRCMRSFHATRKDGEDSDCKSLGFSKAQVEAIQNFLCKNCKYKQHQCFVCGKLGCSDKSKGTEVFSCVNATCGHFYHPKCVAELLFPENKTEAADCEKKIAAGESFTCPVHKCHVCKQGENKEVKEFQFAVCRRCPKSYHRKCLPRKIAFDDIEEEGIIQRAWEDLLPNRILIYCLKHKIDEDLGTPIRNHIVFPEIPEQKQVIDAQKRKLNNLMKTKRNDDLMQRRASVKPTKSTEKFSSSVENQPVARSDKSIAHQVLNFQKQLKPSKVTTEPLHKSDGLTLPGSKKASKEKTTASVPTISSKVAISLSPRVDVETQKKMLAFMEEVTSSITLEGVLRKRTVPSTHTHGTRNIDRTITRGKIEGSVEAIKTALEKMENGGSVEDAKAVCEPDVIKQIMRWNNKLKVYLAPFLHGMRYTSFGRHFTKVDKLQEIVDKLQWYVQNGDTIVDFCCGANDFSRLMKEKLDAAGKKCSFRNYDIIQPKYDFNFEKRDWMSVQPRELPPGSQLIMGLNPPFGVKAGLANKFIDKALSFKPKLVILIVPRETERLDRKRSPYDLVWEDSENLSGKSFYLPGSVDQNDMQLEQWNLIAPPLYLWSRPDWTPKHKAIALKQGHISQVRQEPPVEERCQEQKSDIHPPKEVVSERPEDKEAIMMELPTRNGNNKVSAESKKRSLPEHHSSRPTKKSKAKSKMREEAKGKEEEKSKIGVQEEVKRKEQESANRNEGELSDMSISPIGARESNMEVPRTRHSVETFETPRESFETSTERQSNERPGLAFGAISEGGRASYSVEDIDDIAKRYATPPSRDAVYNSSSHGWPGDRLGNQDHVIRNSEERYSGYSGLDTFSRSTYADGYGRSLDADPRALQPRPYGEDDFLQRARYSSGITSSVLGHNEFPTSSYGLSSSTQGSVMQRYAPQLDEMNHPRSSPNLGLGGRSTISEVPGMRRDVPPPDSFGFAREPQYPYQHPGAGGWLDD